MRIRRICNSCACHSLTAPSSDRRLGYSWDPQIITKLTIPLVFYPICMYAFRSLQWCLDISSCIPAAIFSLLSWISLIPLLANRKVGMGGLFSVLALMSFLTSLVAFGFMIALWSIARKRFEDAGFGASFGPLVSQIENPILPRIFQLTFLLCFT